MQELIKRLESMFSIGDVARRKAGQVLFTVQADRIPALLGYLKEFEGFSNLILISVVDWIEEDKFQMTYILNHPDTKKDLIIRSYIPREGSSMISVHELWGHAATFQREIKEMYGIDFPGSPGVDEPFLLEGWDDIPPMRREFDTLKYAEETYFPRPGRETNDPASFMKTRLYPDEK